jgi:hypothetical protein
MYSARFSVVFADDGSEDVDGARTLATDAAYRASAITRIVHDVAVADGPGRV